MKVKCKICGASFEIEEGSIIEKYVQCPFCGSIGDSPK